MMPLDHTLDHIVCAVPNLEQAVADFAEKAGVQPIIGGKHPQHGTKNALVCLGTGSYLEFLAVDEENDKVSAPRWMGVDLIEKPQIVRWAIKSFDLPRDQKILRRYHPDLGEIAEGSRRTPTGDTLRWSMTLPLPDPAVELMPFMCDWRASDLHPTDTMGLQTKILALGFLHPEPEKINAVFTELHLRSDVVKGEKPLIIAKILTPNGILTL